MAGQALLSVDGLTTSFGRGPGKVRAVADMSFDLAEGEVLAIVGESGSGKSVTMRSIMGIIPMPPGVIESGTAFFDGADLLAIDEEHLRRLRGKDIAMVFQDAMTSLNPVLTVGRQITEVLEEHLGMTGKAARDRAIALLDEVGIPDAAHRIDEYPHQFSGGMRQRAMIALAIACGPRLLIADEPTTALDVTIQAQIIDLVVGLQTAHDMGIVWISHDLGVVARIAQKVIVMYAGRVVERATVEDLFDAPAHPYTIGLLASLPRLDQEPGEHLDSIPGQPPNASSLPPGCAFAPRCPLATETCRVEVPPVITVGDGHHAACHRLDEVRRREGRLPWT